MSRRSQRIRLEDTGVEEEIYEGKEKEEEDEEI
jgi:hypothetical protein